MLLVYLCASWAALSAAGAEPPATRPAATPATAPATQPATAPAAPSEELVSLSFREAPVEQIFLFISTKTGKPVIPADSIKQKRLTIVSTQQKPLPEAMAIIQEALRQNGIILEESPRLINMKAIADARQSTLQVVSETQSVADLPNKSQVVHKVFALEYFDVAKMKDVVLPMLPDFGHVVADPNTRKLVVTDTVSDLERIERVIKSLDVAQAEQTIKKIIVVKQGDAADIVAMVRVLIASSLGSQARDVLAGTGGAAAGAPGGGGPGGRGGGGGPRAGGGGPVVMTPDGPQPMSGGGPGGPGGGGPSGGGPAGGATAASAVFVEENKAPVVLLADVGRNWIIAVAPARIMLLIDEWVCKLDVPASSEALFDIHEIKFADMDEVARQISQTLDAIPTGDAKQSIRLVPFPQSRKLLVSGSARGRELVRDLLKQLDQAAGNQTMRIFELKHADAEQVAGDIDALYGNGKKDNSYNPYYFDFSSSRRPAGNQRVKVTADTRRNAVIVISDPQMLDQIDKMLKEQWDLPLKQDDVQPKIYVLKHSDPVKVKELLQEMFSKKERRTPRYFYDFLEEASTPQIAPVGRLWGQFTFQSLPDSNRLVVITKSQANYEVIDRLIEQLDQPQEAGVPQMLELKHANAEDLAEQLNASLAEEGTLAEILRAKRELGSYTRTSGLPTSPRGNDANQQNQNYNQQARGNGENPGVMSFWWQRAQRRTDEKPTSNLIGKIRFVPINRRNALLVVAPQAYMEPIRDLVEQLDRPGVQVLIHAIIAEVQHDDLTTLGIRFASDPSLLNDPAAMDSAIGANSTLNLNQLYGGTYAIGGTTFGRTVLNANFNVAALIQLLIRNVGMKILFEPKLYTADNQEAEFFDGQDVPYETQAQSSPEGSALLRSFSYTAVGTRLRIRPHITKESDVDLIINLELSNIVPGQTTFGNYTFDRRETTTHVVMRDGQTVMLSGIVNQEDSKDVRKFPLLGDIPLIGEVFRSTSKTKRNRELVAFITPHVIKREDEPAMTTSYKDWLMNLRKEMNPPKDSGAPAPSGAAPATQPATQGGGR